MSCSSGDVQEEELSGDRIESSRRNDLLPITWPGNEFVVVDDDLRTGAADLSDEACVGEELMVMDSGRVSSRFSLKYDTPKSAILATPSELTSKFCGLISR